jgi:hypothetical protein
MKFRSEDWWNDHVHDLSKLLSLAGLEDELEAEMNTNPDLHERWTVVKEWSERARYEIWTEASASAMIDAVGGDEGLLQWLQNRLWNQNLKLRRNS